jgi:hypothetical protein
MTEAGRASRRAAVVVAAVLIVDQLTKQLVRGSIALGESRHLLPVNRLKAMPLFTCCPESRSCARRTAASPSACSRAARPA